MPARAMYAKTGRAASSRIFAPLLVPLLGDVEVVLDAIGLQVSHAGPDHRRDPAAGDEERADQGQVADPLQGVGRNGLQE